MLWLVCWSITWPLFLSDSNEQTEFSTWSTVLPGERWHWDAPPTNSEILTQHNALHALHLSSTHHIHTHTTQTHTHTHYTTTTTTTTYIYIHTQHTYIDSLNLLPALYSLPGYPQEHSSGCVDWARSGECTWRFEHIIYTTQDWWGHCRLITHCSLPLSRVLQTHST